MKVLMLCGVFHQMNQDEVASHAKRGVEYSANLFQQKLIKGFQEVFPSTEIISAPFIGSYPNGSDICTFKGFEKKQDEYQYVHFSNIWGYRNISRTRSLKKAIKNFIDDEDDQKLILVYCAHTPFLEAAMYAKEKKSNIKVCVYVPDLPNYMNLRTDKTKIYDFFKKYDVKRIHSLMEQADSFVLLTEQMKSQLPIYDKPCLIREGIVSEIQKQTDEVMDDGYIYIVYSGKMDEKFGILNLLKAFKEIQSDNYRLVLCGVGDCDSFVGACAKEDKRIIQTGLISPEQVKQWQSRASVLINPRENNDEYTKYSFPSKNIEYLMTGKPVVTYMLEGMPRIYKDFIFEIDPLKNPENAIQEAIEKAVNSKAQENKYQNFLNYVECLKANDIANEILKMTMKTEMEK